MILIDNKPILELGNSPVVREYNALTKRLENEHSFPIVLEITGSKVVYENGVEYIRPTLIPLKCSYNWGNTTMPTSCEYIKNPNDASNQSRSSWVRTQGIYQIPESRKDEAIFLLYILRDENDVPFLGNKYTIYSNKVANQVKARTRAHSADLTFQLYGDSSLSKDIRQLVKIGKAMGMSNLEYDSKIDNSDEIKNNIYEFVMAGEERSDRTCNIEAFKTAISAYMDTSIKAFVQDCLDDKIIHIEDKSVLLSSTGDWLFNIPEPTVNVLEQITNAFINNPDKRKMVEAVKGDKAYEGETLTLEEIESTPIKVLKRLMKDLKIKFANADTEDEVRQKAKDAFNL